MGEIRWGGVVYYKMKTAVSNFCRFRGDEVRRSVSEDQPGGSSPRLIPETEIREPSRWRPRRSV